MKKIIFYEIFYFSSNYYARHFLYAQFRLDRRLWVAISFSSDFKDKPKMFSKNIIHNSLTYRKDIKFPKNRMWPLYYYICEYKYELLIPPAIRSVIEHPDSYRTRWTNKIWISKTYTVPIKTVEKYLLREIRSLHLIEFATSNTTDRAYDFLKHILEDKYKSRYQGVYILSKTEKKVTQGRRRIYKPP